MANCLALQICACPPHLLPNGEKDIFKLAKNQKAGVDFALFGFPQIGNLMTPAQNHQASECCIDLPAFSLKSHAALLRIAAWAPAGSKPSGLSPNKTMDDWSKLVQQIACDDCTSTANYRLNQTVWSCWKCFPTWSSFLGTSLPWINLPIHLLHSQLVCQHMFDFVCVLSPFQNKQCAGIQPYGIVVDWQHKHILNLAKIGGLW